MRLDLEQRFNVNKITALENDLKSKKKQLKQIIKENDIQFKLKERNDQNMQKRSKESVDQRDQLSDLAQELINKKQEVKRLQKEKLENEKAVKHMHETIRHHVLKNKHSEEVIKAIKQSKKDDPDFESFEAASSKLQEQNEKIKEEIAALESQKNKGLKSSKQAVQQQGQKVQMEEFELQRLRLKLKEKD